MSKYVIKRNEVMAGRLLMVLPIEPADYIIKKIPSFSVYKGLTSLDYRGMLYSVDENNLANDLVYTTPTNYSIDGLGEVVLSKPVNFVLTNNIQLDELLKYLGFREDLTRNDINKIFNMLIKHKNWLMTHLDLFGVFDCLFGSYIVKDNNAMFSPKMFYELNKIEKAGYEPQYGEPGIQLIKKIK